MAVFRFLLGQPSYNALPTKWKEVIIHTNFERSSVIENYIQRVKQLTMYINKPASQLRVIIMNSNLHSCGQ